ncbi:hypothetical protein [Paraliomyxa miuraensis]|uniref:hypothetical protein n=1 Tax=Paraliomyxa miuraensis TaxID=376150 RepID=UPI00224F0FCA|nr:hypothetical protein [Paraliomyxa miuraensis]MCX4247396.1 hypothetical protein [Paraliomyxa miuraensis]
MPRSFHALGPGPTAAILSAATFVLLCWSCGRTIEEDPPRELVEHRIEPCTQWCTNQLDPECGAIIEDQAWRAVDDCMEDCAAVEPEYAWPWGRQPDGTDACAEEWFAAADCIDALTCEERRTYFRWIGPDPRPDHLCKEQLDARRRCYYDAIEQGGGET